MCLVEAERFDLVPSDAEQGRGPTPAAQDTYRSQSSALCPQYGRAGGTTIAPTFSR
jgi:hypothetical protein